METEIFDDTILQSNISVFYGKMNLSSFSWSFS